MKIQNLAFMVTVFLVFILLAATYKPKTVVQTQVINIPTTQTINENRSRVSLIIPAVDERGEGITTTLVAEIRPGTGKAMVDVNQLLFWVDTQYSIQVAKQVAEKVTHTNLTNFDLIYTIETNASVIGGPSAGATLTIATIALILGKDVNRSVAMTGTINEDGTIGQVGSVVEKAKAAKEAGATLFLVPAGQSFQKYYKPEQKCEKLKFWTICTTEYKVETVNVSEVGIDVVEVHDIQEAMKYFLVG